MVKKDELRTVTVKLEDYASNLDSYWAREEDYFLSGRFGQNGPNLVMRIPMQMPKRINGSGFVDVEHWSDFCPFLTNGTSMLPESCQKAKAIAGKFRVREYCGRQLNTFEIQSPKRAPHLLVGPITMSHFVEQSKLDATLLPGAVYLHSITNPDDTRVRTCYVVIRFGDRINPATFMLERSSSRAKRDRASICQEYSNWLVKELAKNDTYRPSDAQLAKSHGKSSQKFLRAVADLENMVESINKSSCIKHMLNHFPGGVTYDGEIYYEKKGGLKRLTDLVYQQFSDMIQVENNVKEVIRSVKSLDTDNHLVYLHLDLIQSQHLASFILRNASSSEYLCSYTYGNPDTGDYGELLSLPPEDLANKIWQRFHPAVLAAVIRFEQLKALQACDQEYNKKHPRATSTRRIEPAQYL